MKCLAGRPEILEFEVGGGGQKTNTLLQSINSRPPSQGETEQKVKQSNSLLQYNSRRLAEGETECGPIINQSLVEFGSPMVKPSFSAKIGAFGADFLKESAFWRCQTPFFPGAPSARRGEAAEPAPTLFHLNLCFTLIIINSGAPPEGATE